MFFLLFFFALGCQGIWTVNMFFNNSSDCSGAPFLEAIVNPELSTCVPNPCVKLPGLGYVVTVCNETISKRPNFAIVMSFSDEGCKDLVYFRMFPHGVCVYDSTNSFLANCSASDPKSVSICKGAQCNPSVASCAVLKDEPGQCNTGRQSSSLWAC